MSFYKLNVYLKPLGEKKNLKPSAVLNKTGAWVKRLLSLSAKQVLNHTLIIYHSARIATLFFNWVVKWYYFAPCILILITFFCRIYHWTNNQLMNIIHVFKWSSWHEVYPKYQLPTHKPRRIISITSFGVMSLSWFFLDPTL